MTEIIDRAAYEQLKHIERKGGVAVGGDAFNGCYAGMSDPCCDALGRRGLLRYQGFSEHWQWVLTPEGLEAIDAYEAAYLGAGPRGPLDRPAHLIDPRALERLAIDASRGLAMSPERARQYLKPGDTAETLRERLSGVLASEEAP